MGNVGKAARRIHTTKCSLLTCNTAGGGGEVVCYLREGEYTRELGQSHIKDKEIHTHKAFRNYTLTRP